LLGWYEERAPRQQGCPTLRLPEKTSNRPSALKFKNEGPKFNFLATLLEFQQLS
jgi:hypothetical protein